MSEPAPPPYQEQQPNPKKRNYADHDEFKVLETKVEAIYVDYACNTMDKMTECINDMELVIVNYKYNILELNKSVIELQKQLDTLTRSHNKAVNAYNKKKSECSVM
jgi:hypothetical protein